MPVSWMGFTLSPPVCCVLPMVRFAALCLFAGLLAGSALAMSEGEPAITVQRDGRKFDISLDMSVPVPPAQAWAVLTDFDHMPRFLPNLKESHVVSREGNRWVVMQRGETGGGPFSFGYESLREIELVPQREIRSHSLKGNLGQVDGLTTLTAERQGTRIHYHAVAQPGWLVGSVLGEETLAERLRLQFQQMRAEMLRRQASGLAVAPAR